MHFHRTTNGKCICYGSFSKLFLISFRIINELRYRCWKLHFQLFGSLRGCKCWNISSEKGSKTLKYRFFKSSFNGVPAPNHAVSEKVITDSCNVHLCQPSLLSSSLIERTEPNGSDGGPFYSRSLNWSAHARTLLVKYLWEISVAKLPAKVRCISRSRRFGDFKWVVLRMASSAQNCYLCPKVKKKPVQFCDSCGAVPVQS